MKRALMILAILILATYVFVFFGVKYGWTNVSGVVDEEVLPAPAALPAKPDWASGEEWPVLAAALAKDTVVITRVGTETGISPRLLAAIVVPEQLRLFHSEREVFKQFFQPLKILGSQTQFSWGVVGLKPETASEIEARLAPEDKALLAFTTTNPDQERFVRLTDEHDHYFSYLYAALYLKEIITQWQQAGFDISNRPEILATLFNIGFAHSEPKAAPQVGGAAIEIGGRSPSFGRLAYEFYYSKELLTEFPTSFPSSGAEKSGTSPSTS